MFARFHSRTAALVTTMALIAVLCVAGATSKPSAAATVDVCGVGGNPVACENSKPGSPASVWDTPNPSSTIEGYTTDTSVNVGGTVNFKIKTPSTGYRLDIYRIGYYAGNGARLIASVNPSASLPQTQPACLTNVTTGLIDCGNWGVSASWAVPATAVSGVYEAKLVRTDSPGLNNQIMFVVRNDASHSDLTYQTSDTTWQAYNSWGGNSLYVGNPAGRAYKVSFNRPYNTRTATPAGQDFFFSTEYPMVRFLEANGYDVSYQSGLDTDRAGSRLLNHKTFLSVGHDEYWSGPQRANVEAARDAGVNLAFFSGNIALWKTRYEASTDGSNTPYRTLVSYKETKAAAKIDPSAQWTGSWRDTRFSPPSDGGRPENAMTGTLWLAQSANDTMNVPAEAGKLRLWRNTSMATLAAGTNGTLPRGVLGYEYDVDVDNGFRPAGLFDLSSSTNTETEVAQNFGATVAPGTVTHSLTEYRASSGAIVFSAGTVQWTYGLDANHDLNWLGVVDGTGDPTPSTDMKQATVNILADQGAQPVTLDATLTVAAKSTDTTAPTSTITSPTSGATFTNGAIVTVTGTAADVGGKVAGVEVSLDGGTSWHPATGRGSWSYTGSFSGNSATSVRVRATDDSGNIQSATTQVPVTVSCPCSIFGLSQSPTMPADTDTSSVSLGVKFQSSAAGWITGVRFYKVAGNTGVHTGSLWNTSGQRLATVSFSGETASGWQQANFTTPVQVTAGTTYVVSYYTPNGRYAGDSWTFTQTGAGAGPVKALSSPASGGNGVYGYGVDVFPSAAFGDANYWVDAILSTTPPGSSGPSVLSQSPAAGATNVAVSTAVSATFDQSVQPASAVVSVTGPGNVAVAGTTTYTAASKTVTFTPAAALAGNTPYNVSVTATDLTGHAMTNPSQWSFTTVAVAGSCPCTLWPASYVPPVPSVNDPSSVELGVRFSADRDGLVSGLRFYKGSSNVGTHVGTLWSSTGTQLARATFTSESASGWQQVSFASPVAITAGVGYVASYHTSGYYSASSGMFAGASVDNSPLHAPASTGSALNGLYAYGASPSFPTSSYNSTSYSVDVVFVDGTDTAPPTVTTKTPAAGATGVATSTTVKAVMSERLQPASSTIVVTGPSGAVAGSTSYDDPSTTVTFTPAAALAASTTYSATLSGSTDLAGNVITAPVSWSFTTLAADTTKPTVVTKTPAAGATGVATSTTVKAVMSERLQTASSTIVVTGPSGAVAGSTSYDDPSTTVTFTPAAALALNTTYTATLSGSTDLAGNVIAAPVAWTFTTATAPTSVTLFGSQVPAVAASTDTGNVELGVRFSPDVNGTITGVRFYKGAGNTGTHTGTLWNSAGTQLATGTFTGETATGWQVLTFTTPVSVTAGQTYTASYHAPVGRYSYSSGFFASPYDLAPLHAPAASNGGNGVYVYGAQAFPSSTYGATNYWVDAVFLPASGGAPVSGAVVSSAAAAPSLLSTYGLDLQATVPAVTRFRGPAFLNRFPK